MNGMPLEHLTDDELLRYADQSDPVIKELCGRLEEALEEIALLDPKAEATE